ERFVTGRVEEDDPLAVVHDLAGADVLGDAAALSAGDIGRPDRVEEAGLAMVDVTHDGHDRRTRLEVAGRVLLEQDLLGRLGDLAVTLAVDAAATGGLGLRDLVPELAGDQPPGVASDQLVEGGRW